jgi:hypothetical protein
MALIAKKVQGSVPERLRRFVAENLEALEPGLNVLETSLRLGRSAVDVVAVDGKQTLVLVAVAEVADASMLISTLDAYIWCLAFPDNMRRLYPDAAIAATRPPRVVFVAAQMPAAFLDLIERLSMINPECHELAAVPDGEDAPTVSAATVAGPTLAVRPTVEAGAELPLAVTEPRLADVETEPEPELLQAAARLSAGFDAAVARQWESFLVESPVGGSERQAEPQTPVAASTATWPPRVPPYRPLNGVPTAQPSNGQTPTMQTTSAAASNGHLTNDRAANGQPTNGHQAIVIAPAGSETDGPISLSVLANGHAANSKAGSGQASVAHAAEALLAQAIRAAEPAPVEHAAVNLGVRPRVEAPAALAAPAPPPAAPVAQPALKATPEPKPAAPRAVAEPKPAAPSPAHDETRTVNHPALQALRFPKSGVSRQWQEFLDQLAANQ